MKKKKGKKRCNSIYSDATASIRLTIKFSHVYNNIQYLPVSDSEREKVLVSLVNWYMVSTFLKFIPNTRDNSYTVAVAVAYTRGIIEHRDAEYKKKKRKNGNNNNNSNQ